jgi:hypothetical protein
MIKKNMKRLLFLTAILTLSTITAFSQAKPTDFSGIWTLDLTKSKLDARARIDSLTMTVAQTDKDLKVSTETKRTPPPADASASAPGTGAGPGRGMGRGGGFGSGDGSVTYSLDGKETIVEIDGPNGKLPVKYKAGFDGAKLNLSNTRSFSGPMGEVTITTKESWSLAADGKTLTVERENTTPRGTTSSTLVFAKK